MRNESELRSQPTRLTWQRSRGVMALVAVLFALAACQGSVEVSGVAPSGGGTGGGGGGGTGGGGGGGGGTGGGGGGGGGTPATGTYTVSWDTVSDPAVTGYRVYYNTVPFISGGLPGHLDVTKPITSVDIQPGAFGITAGTTVYVAVASRDANGSESPLSLPTSIVVQ